jgi:hypothetical protein
MKHKLAMLLVVLCASFSMAAKLFRPLEDCHVFQRNNVLFMFDGHRFDTLTIRDNIINYCIVSDSILAYITSDGLVHMHNVVVKNEFVYKSIGSVKPKKVVCDSGGNILGIDTLGNFYSFEGDEWQPSETLKCVKDIFYVEESVLLQLDSAFVKINGTDTTLISIGHKITKANFSGVRGVYVTDDNDVFFSENISSDWFYSGRDTSINSKINSVLLFDSVIYIARDNKTLTRTIVGNGTPASRLFLPETPTFIGATSHSFLITDAASNFILTDHSLYSWTFNGNTNGQRITGLAIIDSMCQVAVGEFYCIKTVDKGNMWYPLNIPNELVTYSPLITSYGDGVLIAGSLRLVEIDSLSQLKDTILGSQGFTAMHATNGKIVIAERGRIFIKNGDSPWVTSTNGIPPIGFYSLNFTDLLHGYAGSMSKVFETKNGGLSWSEKIPYLDGAEVIGIAFIGNTSLFISSSGGVKAYDGQQIVIHNPSSEQVIGRYYYRGIAACGDSAYFVGGLHSPLRGFEKGGVE